MARIAPDHITPEQARLAALRVSAAQIRDRQGPHAAVSTELAEWARLLAQALDAAEQSQRPGAATNLAPGLQETAARDAPTRRGFLGLNCCRTTCRPGASSQTKRYLDGAWRG